MPGRPERFPREPFAGRRLCGAPDFLLSKETRMLILTLLAAASLNDPQIANVALTAHRIDVDRGKLALKHTKNDEVKQFADQMVHDHQAGIQEAVDLAKRLNVKPAPSEVAKSLDSDAKKATARLSKG